MLFYRILNSEGIDFEKTGNPKECGMCHYWFFKRKKFKFQLCLCNGCHHKYMLAFNINQVTTSNIGEYHDRCYFINMIEEEAKKKKKHWKM